MSKNTNLHAAKQAQKDEFYTQMSDIEIEMNAYLEYDKDVFRDKVIFCNCDDPYESNFFKYFALRFNDFGLKQLIATCYSGSPVAGTQLTLFDEPTPTSPQKTAYKVIINEVKDFNGDGAVDLEDIKKLLADENNIATELDGNGDFRSEECVELLKTADIVITNPPWSLYREFVALLIEYNKDFLILGNKNSITYKEIFPLIKNNKMWIGPSIHSGGREFMVPSYYDKSQNYRIDEEGNKYVNFPGPRWFTTLPNNERFVPLQLMSKADNLRYNKQLKKALAKLGIEEYPKYDNYDAIEIPITAAIPSDYKGVMGVPITFLDKYCPAQFEIIGSFNANNETDPAYCYVKSEYKPAITNKKEILWNGPIVNRQPLYKRICIKYTDQWIKDHPNDFKD